VVENGNVRTIGFLDRKLVLEFDMAAREFQSEQSIVRTDVKSFKINSITDAAAGDTNSYLHRKEQLARI
jgi:hypothetical protein